MDGRVGMGKCAAGWPWQQFVMAAQHFGLFFGVSLLAVAVHSKLPDLLPPTKGDGCTLFCEDEYLCVNLVHSAMLAGRNPPMARVYMANATRDFHVVGKLGWIAPSIGDDL